MKISKASRVFAALTLAFAPLFISAPAQAQPLVQGDSLQFTYYWGSYSREFTDQTVTVTVTNNITNKIGGNGEIIDTYRITLGDQVIEVTEKHDARDYTFNITGTQTLLLEGIDRGFWAGYYGPIMTISTQAAPPAVEAVTESPTVSEPVTESITVSEEATQSETISPQPEPIIPPPPTAAETKDIAEDIIDSYAAFWAKYGLDEADYSRDSRVVTYKWIQSQYVEMISANKISKALTAALAMKTQVSQIEAAYLAGDLIKNPVPKPEPVAPPVQPEPTPTPAPQPEPSPEPAPIQPSPEPTSSPEPTASPEPQLPATESPLTESPDPISESPVLPEPVTESPSLLPIAPEPKPLLPVFEQPSESSQQQSSESEQIAQPSSTSSEAIEVPEETQSEEASPAEPEVPATMQLQEIGAAVAAIASKISSLGLDMSPEAREKAQEALVAGVIVPQIAAQAAAVAASRKVR